MAQLAEERGDAAGAPLVLAGWLYLATLPRQLSRSEPAGPRPLSPQAALALLQRQLLPQARQRLDAIDERLRPPLTSATLRDVLGHAWAAFITMIDIYVGTLVPARRHHAPAPLRVDPTDPLTLRGRGEYLDVLPATWDLASPSLAELGVTVQSSESDLRPLPTDPSRAAALLAEWDDHLFALGLAPLRNLYRAVGRATGLDHDVFLLRGPELLAALDGVLPDLDRRRSTQQSQQRLTPPLSIDDGQPVTARTRARWSGIAVGAPFTGEAARRDDLSALLADPPPPTSVVMMPALTAPAAVALHAAGVRAVCCEHGGPLSHAALMARELGLSALIGCRGCMSVADGTTVTVDTRVGRLRIGT
ncbi:MAG: hypothetical protein JKY37_24350 [Nannocystaceae bacterium]|nr:hypothetical protein [Nannocystaceae bacterium]